MTLVLALTGVTIAQGVTEPGALPIVEEPITLTAMVSQTPDIIDFQTNAYSLWMEEQTNIHIEYEQVPSSSLAEKISVVLAGGDLPDIFLGCALTAQQEMQYGMGEGMLIPLNDLIETYGQETKRVFAESPLMKEMSTNMDGNIYALPTWSALEHTQVPQRAWINTHWLEQLNLEVPETTEEFVAVMKTFITEDPNGNGEADEIGILGSPNLWHGIPDSFFINSFTYYDGKDGEHLEAGEDGKLSYIGVKEEYKEALRFMNRLYTEGLLYEPSYTQSQDQAKQICNNPNAEVVGFITCAQLYDAMTVGSEYYEHFDSMAPLSGPEGVRLSAYLPYSNVRIGAFAISDTCEYPEAAFRWADYAYTYDASIRLRQGKYLEDWRLAEEGELDFEDRPAQIARLNPWLQEAQNNNWGNTGLWYETAEMRSRTALNDPDTDLYSADGLQKFWHVKQKKYWDYIPPMDVIVPPLRYTLDELNEIAVAETEIKSMFNQYKVRFIMGELNLDSDWEVYLSDLERVGLSKWLEVKQAAYDRYMQ